MNDATQVVIVTNWDRLPPIVTSEGEVFSTRLLKKQHDDLKHTALKLCQYIMLINEISTFDGIPELDCDEINKVLRI